MQPNKNNKPKKRNTPKGASCSQHKDKEDPMEYTEMGWSQKRPPVEYIEQRVCFAAPVSPEHEFQEGQHPRRRHRFPGGEVNRQGHRQEADGHLR